MIHSQPFHRCENKKGKKEDFDSCLCLREVKETARMSSDVGEQVENKAVKGKKKHIKWKDCINNNQYAIPSYTKGTINAVWSDRLMVLRL